MRARKVQAKARLEKPKPIRILVDPTQLKESITLPEISYEMVATYEEKAVYIGKVIPLPEVLPYYLKHMELLCLITIMEETFKHGECRLTIREIALRLKVTTVSVTSALYSLRKQGLIMEGKCGENKGKLRKVNYQTIQYLTDLAHGHDIGVLSRIRKATRKKEIRELTEEDICGAYDNEVLPPGHDPREEEEYN